MSLTYIEVKIYENVSQCLREDAIKAINFKKKKQWCYRKKSKMQKIQKKKNYICK